MKKLSYVILLITITVIIGLLQLWSAPTMSDDILYRFIWQTEWQSPLEPITSVGDVIKSQLVHYECINGRSILHFIGQVMINLIPEEGYKIINTLMFLLLIGSVVKYVSKEKVFYGIITALTFGLLFLVIKGFGTAFIWSMGSFNYTWSLLFTMAFLLLLRRLGKREISWSLVPLIPLSFLFGWTHEAIALPVSISIIAYIIIHRKDHLLHQTATYCMFAYCLGMSMILSSPALWWRTDLEGISLSQRLFYGCINIIFGIRISWILILSLLMIWFRKRQHFKDFISQHIYLLLAWLAAMGIVFVCGSTLDRVVICADFLAMLIVLQLWQGKWLLQYQTVIIALIITISIFTAIPAFKLSYQNYQNYRYHCQQLEQKDNYLIKVRQLPHNMSLWMSMIIGRYITPTIEFNFHNCYMAFDKKDNNNRCAAYLYNRQEVVFLPEDVVDNIQRNPQAYQEYATDEHHNLYIRQLKPEEKVNKVTFILGDEVPIHFYQRILTYPDYTYELDAFNYEVLDISNRKYLVMTIPPSNISRRIKQISIE
jgi:hypothetical protein